MVRITNIIAIEILDSRGNPTIKTFVELENGVMTYASVPSGASTGTHEACELRDTDSMRYLGKGVLKAVSAVNTIIGPELKGMFINKLQDIDKKMIELDGTENKTKLGANAILSVSLACMRAYALALHKPLWKTINEYYFFNTPISLPRLMVNVINGGKHADWNFDIQEFMISPKERKPSESIRRSAEFFHILGNKLKKDGFSTLVGDEGGYSPAFESNEHVFDVLYELIQSMQQDIDLAIDAAASEFYQEGYYVFRKNHIKMTAEELTEYYLAQKKKYNIMSFEDIFFEDDFNAFAEFTKKSHGTQVVGDDLYTTNLKRINIGIEKQATNTVLIKPNQIGTLWETVQAIKMTKEAGWKLVISHRSGETDDSFIADLAVACGAEFLKAGSMSRGERMAKYNRLLEIEAFELH